MASKTDLSIEENVQKNSDMFKEKIEANTAFSSSYMSDLLAFDWLDEIEEACPYMDTIIRDAKLFLIKEEEVVLIEKSKRINVSSIKDLAKHTERIKKYDPKFNDVQPSKILDIRNEETYNIYENRFLYTVIKMLRRFITEKEDMLKKLELRDNKRLEYKANTITTMEKVDIELVIKSVTLPSGDFSSDLKKKIAIVKKRIKRIKEYLASWERSQMYKDLELAHVSLIDPPIRKTNLILKNPNFQATLRLWEYLYKLEDENEEEDDFEGRAGNILESFLDHSFLIDYYVMESMAVSKRVQKKEMAKYAIYLLTEEIHHIVNLMKKSGLTVTNDDILKIISAELNSKKKAKQIGNEEVKKKFKSAMDEYLERAQDCL